MPASVYDLRKFHFCVDFFLFIIGTFYVILVPYTKVEESFNMQATHDMLFYGYTNIDNYDHNDFPGVVPRTFIGPFILSLIIQPFKLIIQCIFPLIFTSFNIKMICHCLIRTSLLCINIAAQSYFRKSFIKAYIKQKSNETIKLTKAISIVFAILICSQFHYLFYVSRLLPNCFALALVTISFAFYFEKKYHLALQCLAASTIIFRCDTIVIAFPFIIIMLSKAYKQYRFRMVFIRFIYHGIMASIVCILLSLLIDSWFWTRYQSLKWAEFQVLLYNTIDNKSSNWGISPWNEYFTSHLIKMLLVNILFIPFSFLKMNPLLLKLMKANKNKSKWKLCLDFVDFESIEISLICLIFIALYSFLPHKETRFIFFVIPPFTLLSTIGCIRLVTLWGFKHLDLTQFTMEYYHKNIYKKQSQSYFMSISRVNSVILILIIISVCLSYFVVFLGVLEASYNYCGGTAITTFESIVMDRSCYNYNNILNDNIDVNDIKCVHIGNKAAMTGAIRFTVPSYCNEWRFDKTENLLKEQYGQQIDPCHLTNKIGYDYLITEFQFVPQYQLIPNGTIDAKSESIYISIFKYIKQLLLSSDESNNEFLKPALYILKRK